MHRAPVPVLQEGGLAVISRFLGGTAAWGSGGPAPVEVTSSPGGEWGRCTLEQERLVSGCWA